MKCSPKELAEAIKALPAYTTAQLGLQLYRHGDPKQDIVPPEQRVFMLDDVHKPMLLEALSLMQGWRSLKEDPPGPEHRTFFVGHFPGGRMDLVFRWPEPSGKMRFWKSGEQGNFMLTGYTPNRWHPGPPNIPGSDVEKIQQGELFK